MSKQILRMDADYVKDVIAKKEEYDLIKIIAKLPKKILILHGENDLSVPLEEVGKLVDSYTLNPISDEVQPYFVLLSKANHIFNVNHPFESSNQYLDKVCENLIDFLSGD
jgi:dienelactone hydrolase